jgi:predicted phosphodiesterase
MRVAALYDIHGNLPALDAVLGQVRAADVDRIVVGGDVLPGPMPAETLDLLSSLRIPVEFIYGNGEAAVLDQLAGRESPRVPEPYRPAIRWTAEQIRARYGGVVASWPLTHQLTVPGVGAVVFCHATPRDDNECFTALTPEEHLVPIFEALNAAMIVCGHTHMQFDRVVGRTRVVNAGSVGMPFGEPGADWLLLDSGVRLQHTAYDLAQAADRIRATAFPWPEDYSTRYILQPPSAAEMLEVFTRASESVRPGPVDPRSPRSTR